MFSLYVYSFNFLILSAKCYSSCYPALDFAYHYQTLGEGERERDGLVLRKKRLVNLVVDVKILS